MKFYFIIVDKLLGSLQILMFISVVAVMRTISILEKNAKKLAWWNIPIHLILNILLLLLDHRSVSKFGCFFTHQLFSTINSIRFTRI